VVDADIQGFFDAVDHAWLIRFVAVAQGLMVVDTGGFSPQDSSSPAMRALATGDFFAGLPNALIVWGVIGAAAVFLLNRTAFKRAVYGVGELR
jgi:ribose transport system permease protein